MALCCKCPNEARAGGRYCHRCHADAEKAYRDRKREEEQRQQRAAQAQKARRPAR